MSPHSFAHARRIARLVAERSQHVGVVTERAAEVAQAIPPGAAPSAGGARWMQVRHDDRLACLLTLATLRFGTGYAPRLGLPEGWDLESWIAERVAAQAAESGPLRPERMATATTDVVAALLGFDGQESAQVELLELQARALRDLGRFLLERHEGSVVALLESAGNSGERLCEELSTIPFFHDVQCYRGLDVPFLHRAQRFVLDVERELSGDGVGRFDDLGELAPSSDARAVLALRSLGVLVLEPGLARRIEQGELVPAHSEREIELRAAAVHAVDRIRAATSGSGPPRSAFEVDAWLRALEPGTGDAAPPMHRTRTVYY